MQLHKYTTTRRRWILIDESMAWYIYITVVDFKDPDFLIYFVSVLDTAPTTTASLPSSPIGPHNTSIGPDMDTLRTAITLTQLGFVIIEQATSPDPATCGKAHDDNINTPVQSSSSSQTPNTHLTTRKLIGFAVWHSLPSDDPNIPQRKPFPPTATTLCHSTYPLFPPTPDGTPPSGRTRPVPIRNHTAHPSTPTPFSTAFLKSP
ncbi:hypothetical protein BDD12DRAFT_898414 [Trichophaea hybrida]|nr:hypothetical protein BDD12DRAFT_898414 [Trichophaea hybrida]